MRIRTVDVPATTRHPRQIHAKVVDGDAALLLPAQPDRMTRPEAHRTVAENLAAALGCRVVATEDWARGYTYATEPLPARRGQLSP